MGDKVTYRNETKPDASKIPVNRRCFAPKISGAMAKSATGRHYDIDPVTGQWRRVK